MKLSILFTSTILTIILILHKDNLSNSFEIYPFLTIIALYVYELISRTLHSKLNVVDLIIFFLSLYLSLGFAFFSILEFREIVESSVFVNIGNNTLLLSIIQIVYLIILVINYIALFIKARPIKKIALLDKDNKNYDSVILFFLFLTLFYCIYLYYLTGGKYIHFTDIDESVFNRLGWLVTLSSSLIASGFAGKNYTESKILLFLTVTIILILTLLSIRLFSAIFIFSLLVNLQVRGLVINKKAILLFIITFFMIVSRSIFRFQSFDLHNTTLLVVTFLGEFIIPHISTYYLFENSVSFGGWYNFIDLISQLFPYSFRLPALLYGFKDAYLETGINPWPIGGIFFVGQFYFYFGLFGFFVYLILIYFLSSLKSSISRGRSSVFYAAIPPIAIILPRMELWTLRAAVLNVFIILIIKFFLLKLNKR